MYVIFGIPNTRRGMNLYVEESFCLPIFQIRYKEVKIRNCQKLSLLRQNTDFIHQLTHVCDQKSRPI